jgi:alkylated DNA nucleotide flippase Atl1
MRLLHLFQKRHSGDRVEPVDRLTLVQGKGILDDVSAQIGSPRQVLFTGLPVLQQFGLEPGTLQENIVLDETVEQFQSGQVLQLGADALVRLTFLCEPCASLEKVQPGLTRRLRGKRGFLGMVVRDGVVQVGDRVQLTDYQFPVIPETNRERFAEFVARIPQGKVVDTKNLLLALGQTASYARAIPGQIRRSPDSPVHRLVTADHRLFTNHLPDQRQRLEQEGVILEGDRVPTQYHWHPQNFHATNIIL